MFRRKGFSLTELVVALVTLAIVASIGVPLYLKVTSQSSTETARYRLATLTKNASLIHFTARGATTPEQALIEAEAEAAAGALAPGVLAAGDAWTILPGDQAAAAPAQVSWTYQNGLLRTAVLTTEGHPCFAQAIHGADLESWCLKTLPLATAPEDGGDSPNGVAIGDGPGEPGFDRQPADDPSNGTNPQVGPVTPSVKPAIVSVVPANRSLTVTWEPVSGAVDGYYVYLDHIRLNSVTTSGTSATIENLTNGREYDVQVAAYNASGAGPRSEVVSATPAAVPEAPQVSVLTTPGSTSFTVTWLPGVTNGSPVENWLVTLLVGSSPTPVVLPGNVSQHTFNLNFGTPAAVRVVAQTASGQSPEGVAPVMTVQAPPAAPTLLNASSQPGSISLTWSPPASSVSAPVSGFRVYVNGAAVPLLELPSPSYAAASIISLPVGLSHSFQVRAYGPGGVSAPVGPASALMANTPSSAPVVSPIDATGSSVSLSWTPVESTAAQPVYGYRVYVNGAFARSAGLATSTTISGLSHGQAYTFQVAAWGVADSEGPLSAPVVYSTLSPPLVPVDVTASPADGQVTVSWSPVESIAQRPVSGYRVYVFAGSSPGSPSAVVSGTTAAVTGLSNGVPYNIVVRAYGNGGESDLSTLVSATPVAPPAPVADLAALPANNGLNVSWTPVVSSAAAPVLGYNVTVDGGSPVFVAGELAASHALSGLTNGVPSTVTVVAVGPVSLSAPMSVTATPAGPPGQVTGLTATPSNGTIALSWTAVSSSTAAPVTIYRVEQQSGSSWVPVSVVSSTSATVTGLTNGVEVTFRVVAQGPGGLGVPSVPVSATPATVPDAPTVTSVVGGVGQLTVSWTPPGSDGFSAITGYVISYSGVAPATAEQTVSVGQVTSVPLTGLGHGASFSVKVRAVNAQGNSSWSPSFTTNAITIPGQPTADTLTAVNESQLASSWANPQGTSFVQTVFNGGAAANSGLVTAKNYAGLAANTEYTFRVQACNVSGCGPLTAVRSWRTAPAVPLNPRPSTFSDGNGRSTQAFFAWNSSAGASSYQYSINSGAASSVSATSVYHPASPGTTHSARVRACSSFGCSNYTSNVTIGTTPTYVSGWSSVNGTWYDPGSWWGQFSIAWPAVSSATSYKLSFVTYNQAWGYFGTYLFSTSSSSGNFVVPAGGSTSVFFRHMIFIKACNSFGCVEQTGQTRLLYDAYMNNLPWTLSVNATSNPFTFDQAAVGI